MVDVVVEQISSTSKIDLCESQRGLTTFSLPPPPLFIPRGLFALTLHAVDFLPLLPLSPESLENPSDQR